MPRSPAASPGRWSTCSRRVEPVEADAGRGAQRGVELRRTSSTASVVITTSIVARPGASIPAPLAMPPIVQPSAVADRGLRVGVGRDDRGRGIQPAVGGERGGGRRDPRHELVDRSWSPIRPVEQTSTSPALTSSASATASAVACVVWKPSAPVKQLAPPELSTIALTCPSAMTCFDQMIGLACARLLVKTAAALCSGPRLTTSARSGLPEDLSPARDAGRLESGCCGHAHGATPFTGRPVVSGEPERDVGGLDGGTRGALDQIVDRADRRRRGPPARRREADERGVRADGVARARERSRRAARARRARRRRRRLPGVAHVAPRSTPGASRAVEVARIPRDIGTSTGVNEMLTSVAARPRSGSARSRGCADGCRPPDTRMPTRRSRSRAARSSGLLPAPEVPTASTATRSCGSITPAAMPGARPSVIAVTLQPGTAIRVAPTRLSRWRSAVLAAEQQLGQPVGPRAEVLAAVELGPRGRVGQPVIGAAVDDEHVIRKLRR